MTARATATADQSVATPATPAATDVPPVSEAVARHCLVGLMLALGAEPEFVADFASTIKLEGFTDAAGSVDVERVARFSIRWARAGSGGAS